MFVFRIAFFFWLKGSEYIQDIPFTIKTILMWNHDCLDCHREWNSERAVEMCYDFVFVRFHLLAFHFNEFQTCRTQPRSISRQTVDGSPGFVQTIKPSKIDRWFGLIGNQDCNQTKGTSFIAMEPHFGCNPDCFDYEKNALIKRFLRCFNHFFLSMSTNC